MTAEIQTILVKRQRKKYNRRYVFSDNSRSRSPDLDRRHSREHQRGSRPGHHEYSPESYRHRRNYAHGNRIRLHITDVEDEHYGSRQHFNRKERQTLSPTKKSLQAKAASAEDTPHAVRTLPQVEAETRLGRVQVEVEAPTESTLR